MNFYVYYSYEPWGRGYIGSRGCETLPECDTKYFGSYHDPLFSPTEKIILAIFPTREEAVECEIILHDFFEVDVNPHFANQSKQRRNGFYYNKRGEEHFNFGKPCPEHSERMKGEGNPMYGKRGEKSPHYGKKRPDHSEKMRGEKNLNFGKTREEIFGTVVLSGEQHPFYGKKRPQHSLSLKGRKWWTNGDGEIKFQHESPGEEWIEGDNRRRLRGNSHPSYGKKNPDHSAKMKGNKHWINKDGERLFQRENPGEGWQRGLRWKPQQ
jgi:hypothetical protein